MRPSSYSVTSNCFQWRSPRSRRALGKWYIPLSRSKSRRCLLRHPLTLQHLAAKISSSAEIGLRSEERRACVTVRSTVESSVSAHQVVVKADIYRFIYSRESILNYRCAD